VFEVPTITQIDRQAVAKTPTDIPVEIDLAGAATTSHQITFDDGAPP
jgi:hypothetical protein